MLDFCVGLDTRLWRAPTCISQRRSSNRMATSLLPLLWVYVDGGQKPVGVRLPSESLVSDVIQTTIEKEKLDVAASRVNAYYLKEGSSRVDVEDDMKVDDLIENCGQKKENPLILTYLPSGGQVFLVEAVIGNAKNVKGLRAQIFREAEAHMAWCISIDDSITYDGNTLKIKLFFKTELCAWNFRTVLSQWKFSHHFFNFVAPEVKPDLETVTLHSEDLRRVVISDYNAEDSESPCQSLDDYMGSALSHVSSVTLDDPITKYQSLEKPELLGLGGSKAFKIHLKNQGKSYKFQHLANNPNNVLAGTGFFHQFMDGLNMENKKVPIVALKPGDFGEEVEVEPHMKRRKVIVYLEFRDQVAANTVSSFLKSGSVKIDETTWQSSVLVAEPALFKECLEWKYCSTKSIWDKEDDDIASN